MTAPMPPDERHIAESVTDVLIEGLAYYPHYFSTYCIHGLHERCRLTCKHCEKPCLCRCHRAAHIDGGDHEAT